MYGAAANPLKRTYDGTGSDGLKRQRGPEAAPSKVLLCRNLPLDVTDAEFLPLFYPFGPVVQHLSIKNKGQAFVQLGDVNTAVNVVNYYTAAPVQIRGRTIFIGYSNRQEIETRDQAPGSGMDTNSEPSNVLVVTITNLVYPVNVDVLYQVFSKFGRIMKIICFMKNDQQKALVQMESVAIATIAKASLDGQNIYTGCNTLQIGFSRMTDLHVKFNNDKSRDFTNPSLPTDGGQSAYGQPTAPGLLQGMQGGHEAYYQAASGAYGAGAMGMAMGQAAGGLSPVVIASGIPANKLTPDSLFTLFGVYGDVVRVKILFNKTDTALIQFNDANQAGMAIQHLNGLKLGDDTLKVNRSKHTSVAPPRAPVDGQPASENTKDYTGHVLHRFRKADGKNSRNIAPPGTVLHVSGIAEDAGIDDQAIISLFMPYGNVVNFKFFDNNKKMALVEMDSIESAVDAILGIDNYMLAGRHIRVQFSKSTINLPPLAQRGMGEGMPSGEAEYQDQSMGRDDEIGHQQDPTEDD